MFQLAFSALFCFMHFYFVLYNLQLAALPPVEAVVESLESAGVTYTMFDNVSIEPTDERCVPICVLFEVSN